MKQSDSLMRQLIIPVTAGIGLVYFAWQLIRDVLSQGESLTSSMLVAVAVMLAGALYGFWTAYVRYQKYQQEHPAAQPEEPLETPPLRNTPALDLGEDLEDISKAVAALITENRSLLKHFKREQYSGCFQSYACQFEDLMPHLDRLSDEPEALEALAEQVLDLLEADWRSRRTKAPDFNDQLLIAVFFSPALVYSQQPGGEEFCEAFHACWRRRYPNSVYERGSYQQICQGFEKKGMCFITTAVCQAEGKPDDCYELTALRQFRDQWLSGQPEGPELIRRYYDMAPGIVLLIDHQENSRQIYQQLRHTYLEPCLLAIEQEDPDRCLMGYTQMMEDLSSRYCVS